MAHHFSVVVFSDQFGRCNWKPSARPFLAVQQTLGIDPGRVVFVADNPKKDFLGARGVGWRSIRFRHGAGEYAHLEPKTLDHCPDRTVRNLHELLGTLEEMEGAF